MSTARIRTLLPHAGMLAILLLFAIVYYGGIIHKLPSGIHDWAQSDRLSLAINFYDRGMNFFLPATHSLYSKGGVVGVEFPIQAYLAACLGQIFGRESIVTCFRALDILITISGLYALFLIVYRRSKDFIFAAFTPMFFFCSPVYVCYGGGFMPDPASVSVCFIGFLFFFDYLDDNRYRNLYIALAVLTLAALIKTSSVACLASVGIYAVVKTFYSKKWSQLISLILVGTALLGCLVANVLYIGYLDERYGSNLFLAKANPFKTWTQFIDFSEHDFKEKWMQEYFLLQQYPVYILLVVTGLRLKSRQWNLQKYMVALLALFSLLLAYAFGGQLSGHDYYILALFFPLLALLLVHALLNLHLHIPSQLIRAVRTGLIVTAAFLFFFADHQIYKRINMVGAYKKENPTYEWVQYTREALDSLKVPDSSRVIVVDYAPNLGLVYSNRRGYNIPQDWVRSDMNNVRTTSDIYHTDIVLIDKQTVDNIRNTDSTELSHFTILATKANMMILKYCKPQ